MYVYSTKDINGYLGNRITKLNWRVLIHFRDYVACYNQISKTMATVSRENSMWNAVTKSHQSIVEATIPDLQQALSNSSLTSTELVAKYLHRIAHYDCHGPCLNSIPLLNPDVFHEAQQSDLRRAAGKLLGPLDGIPYTLKESMKYKGQPCSSGSPALIDLIANEDSFVAERLRAAGAVCLGRTNTPPMMASGMHRGAHGRAESPYCREYLTAAFSSGSSNGSGTSTAASFAAFGLGSETVSSGRSPASNNALVAYTPSRTVISPRGIWPLYPTCDVVVPHTRTVRDMLAVLDVLTIKDHTTHGDFWRQQTYVAIPEVVRPESFVQLADSAQGSLHGKRIAVPKMYIGGRDSHPAAKPTVVSPDVIKLWERTRHALEALGATVLEADFPLVTRYEDGRVSGHANNVVGFTADWNGKERGELVAYLWDDFLRENGDPKYPCLGAVDGTQMFPRPEGYIPDRYMERANFMDYPGLVRIAQTRPAGRSIWEIEGIAEALPALEAQRKRDLEEWMDRNDFHLVVFPANGDVGRAEVDTNDDAAREALQNGVKYSNGNRALRHMGVPTVSVPMGTMESKGMPVNLTFAGKHGSDAELLRVAWEFEQATRWRVKPELTPELGTDGIAVKGLAMSASEREEERCELTITEAKLADSSSSEIAVLGEVISQAECELEVYIDGMAIDSTKIEREGKTWRFRASFTRFEAPKPLYGGVGTVVGKVMVVVLARIRGKCIAGAMKLVSV